MRNFLLDTDVAIDYLRGNTKAVEFISTYATRIHLSVINEIELYSGVREGAEERDLARFLSLFPVHSVDRQTACKGGHFRRVYAKSHQLGLADALIAAVSEIQGLQIVTLNRKHYPMFQDVFVPYTKNG